MLNDSVLELKGLVHGLLRRDGLSSLNNNNINSSSDLDDGSDLERSSSDDDRLNLVK